MKTHHWITIAGMSIGLAATLPAPAAMAGCGAPEMDRNGPSSVFVHLSPQAAAKTSVAASLKVTDRVTPSAPVQTNSPSLTAKAVVGLWEFTFVSQGNGKAGIPDGTIVDTGYQTWHDDGTEITKSGRPPVTNRFCTGVWSSRTGVWDYQLPTTYSLNHWALSWDSTGTQFIGPTNIRESVQVDLTRNSFIGTFSVDQYDIDGVSVLIHLTGTVAGKRINPS